MEQENQIKTRGAILKDRYILRRYIGDGGTDDGKNFEISITMKFEPLLTYKN